VLHVHSDDDTFSIADECFVFCSSHLCNGSDTRAGGQAHVRTPSHVSPLVVPLAIRNQRRFRCGSLTLDASILWLTFFKPTMLMSTLTYMLRALSIFFLHAVFNQRCRLHARQYARAAAVHMKLRFQCNAAPRACTRAYALTRRQQCTLIAK